MAKKMLTKRDILDKTIGTYDQLDKQRSAGLESVRKRQSIENTELVKEAERLSKKYGKNHPRVKKLQKQIANNTKTLQPSTPPIGNTKK